MHSSAEVASENELGTKTVGEIVAGDYRTAAVFERHRIDFCCGGNRPLADICAEKNIALSDLAQQLQEVRRLPVEGAHDYVNWSLAALSDHIVATHHRYLDENMAAIVGYAQKIARVHGAHHPEVIEIAAIFQRVATEMEQHLRAEETICFTAIKRVEASSISGTAADARDIAILRESLAELHRDHDGIGEAVHRIRHLAHDYAIPDDVCNTFRLTYKKLQEFEDDLHKHVHLENNILFRRVEADLAGG